MRGAKLRKQLADLGDHRGGRGFVAVWRMLAELLVSMTHAPSGYGEEFSTHAGVSNTPTRMS
jgi:hypothetical protein